MEPATIRPRITRRRYYDYYGYPYSYYGPTYDRTIVRSGARYNDAYGAHYYGSTVYGDWY
jgi:hypothetical protein